MVSILIGLYIYFFYIVVGVVVVVFFFITRLTFVWCICLTHSILDGKTRLHITFIIRENFFYAGKYFNLLFI